jgi:putative NIF3 family GTP cyclohydrolase 1 type 2
MQLREMYELAIRKGIEADPRGEDEVERVLQEAKKAYEDMKQKDKPAFDEERFWNPYDDSRILYGEPEVEVESILTGIDIESAEVLLADRLRSKGQRIDAIVAHHPEGRALAKLHEVMHLQEGVLYDLGVPINIAEALMVDRISEVERSLMPVNHNKAVDVARILDIPFMCMHTPADNNVVKFLENLFEKNSPDKLEDVIDLLKEVPEYAEAVKRNAGPKIVVGTPKRRVGKIWVDMTGGTSGAQDAYEKLADAGVGTIVGMHIKEKHREEAKKHHINVIIAGHISSDSLGMNLILDEFEARGINIIPCSGLTRVSRR